MSLAQFGFSFLIYEDLLIDINIWFHNLKKKNWISDWVDAGEKTNLKIESITIDLVWVIKREIN